MLKKTFFSVILVSVFFSSASLHASVLLTGNAQAPNSFTFSIKPHIGSTVASGMFVGAAVGAVNPGTYALCAIGTLETKFTPLAPETVLLNEQSGANPIFNQPIRFLSLFESSAMFSGTTVQPIVVVDALPKNIYLVDHIQSKDLVVLSAENIKDATGTSATNQIRGMTSMLGGYIAAAVTPNASANFGGSGSGIAVVALKNIKLDAQATDEEKKKSVTKLVLQQVDVQPGSDPVSGQTRASAFNTSSSFLAITNPLSAMTNVVDMQWDSYVNRLFVSLQITAGVGGGRALAVGGFEVENNTYRLVFHPIVPATVLDGGNNEMVIAASGQQIAVQKVRTLLTSTWLSYLIIVGGNGAPGSTNQKVSALPLVMSGDVNTNGTIARKDSVPANYFTRNGNSLNGYIFNGRSFTVPATLPEHMPRNDEFEVMVGGGNAPGSVEDIYAYDDTVFISTSGVNASENGMFFSQAIFDELGRIKVWTNWQRVGGTVAPIFGFVPDLQTCNFTMLTGANTSNVTIAQRTQWGKASKDGLLGGTVDNEGVGLVAQVGGEFNETNGGVQGLFNFSAATTSGLSDMSLMIATGLKKILLVQTGTDPVIEPTYGDFATAKDSFTGGAITHDLPIPATSPVQVSISGGVLDELGPINAAEIAVSDPGLGYLFVGGVGGLAVLSAANGDGWATPGLQANFQGLVTGMSFKKVNSYSFVRKILFDSSQAGRNYLYVLTDTQLDRIDLNTSNFGTGVINSVTLASLSTLSLSSGATFLDFIVSAELLMLATSTALYRSGNNVDISDPSIATPSDVLWTGVTVPQSILPFKKLIPITATGRDQDFARFRGSNVLVLDSYIGKNRARLHRLAVVDAAGRVSVDDATVQSIPDYFVSTDGGNGVPSYLVSFGDYKDLMKTDGTAYLHSYDADLQEAAALKIVPQNITVNKPAGLRSGLGGINMATSALVPLDIPTNASITHYLRSSASGSWLAAGSFGLRVNE
jgi:hypothetical protein